MKQVQVVQGNSPVVLAFPHTGTFVPDDILDNLNNNGQALADTDWNIHQLYDGLLDEVTTVRTPIHRYVIDANRDPQGKSLYPGQNTTTLCPLTDFDGNPVYRDGQEPNKAEIRRRSEKFHRPYHDALESELNRIKNLFGFVILYDCHSIRSQIPFLFEAKLPDFNIGTNDGATCERAIESAVVDICKNANVYTHGYTHVLNGRFKGGWTTRHYGRPEAGQHVVQMELAQSTYMREKPPWTYHSVKADRLRHYLKEILTTLSGWRPDPR